MQVEVALRDLWQHQCLCLLCNCHAPCDEAMRLVSTAVYEMRERMVLGLVLVNWKHYMISRYSYGGSYVDCFLN